MNASGIRGVAISDKDNLLIWGSGASSLIHGNNSGLNASVISEVISRDFMVERRDKEEDIVMFAHDFNIGFITWENRVDRAFMFEIKAMA